jgi:hypothetical protein
MRPVAVDVSRFEIEHAQGSSLRLDCLHDLQEVGGRAGEAVKLGDDQDIPFIAFASAEAGAEPAGRRTGGAAGRGSWLGQRGSRQGPQ